MRYPDAWPAVLLALAVFRITRLVGWDDLTITLRVKATGLSDREHHDWATYIDQMRQADRDAWDVPGSQPPPISERRFYLSKMLRCPWCVGFWLSAAAWVLWLAEPQAAVALALPFAVSAVVGLVAKNLDP